MAESPNLLKQVGKGFHLSQIVIDTGPVSITNAKKQNKGLNELGSDGGARPLNLPLMQVFEERN